MRLNGYPIIHRVNHPDVDGFLPGMETILAFREDHEFHPFVVANWAPQMGTNWHGGEYYTDLNVAVEAFNKRAAKRG